MMLTECCWQCPNVVDTWQFLHICFLQLNAIKRIAHSPDVSS